MTLETSPDWLPAGWTRQFKFLKTGRRITHYVNLATGQKFFTKDDLICHTKTSITQCGDRQPISKQVKKGAANGHLNIVAKANEHPKCLPKDWLIEVKTYENGPNIGKTYKVYVDPSTGRKFYSKPEVFKFLKNIEQKNSKSKPKQGASPSTSKIVVKANEHPEWLPKDWFMEVETHKNGVNIEKHCKIYVDPSTGCKFYSKPEVLRFLKNVEQGNSKSKPKQGASRSASKTAAKANEHPEWLPEDWFMEVKAHKKGATSGRCYKIYVDPTGLKFYSKPEVFRFLHNARQRSSKPMQKKSTSFSKSKVVIIRSAARDLPAGWIKELKIFRNANGVREIPYYIDPASGSVFRSKMAVHRHLETQELCRDASSSKKHSDDYNLIDKDKSQLQEAKRQKVKHPATRRQLFKGEETTDGSILCDLDAETFEKGHGKRDRIEPGPTTASLQQIPNRKSVVENVHNRNSETAEISSRDNSVALKASKRKQVKIVSADNLFVFAADVPQAKNVLECGIKRNDIDSKNSGKPNNDTELDLPHGFSNQLAQFESDLVAAGLEPVNPCQNVVNSSRVSENEAPRQLKIHANAELAKQASAYSKSKSNQGFLKPSEEKDVSRKQPQMLETKKTSGTKSEVQPFFPPDPCLESTVETPKGAIPLEDAANDKFVSTPASNVLQEKNLGKGTMKIKRNTKTSNKLKKMKQLDMPLQSSKQLARHEPELMADRVPPQVGFQNVSMKSGNIEPKTPCILVEKSNQNLNIDPNSKLLSQASAAAVNHEDRTFLEEPLQMLGTQCGSDIKSELQPLFCSDPCLEFAIKTLTGAIPLEDAINEGLVTTPVANVEQQKNVGKIRVKHSSSRTTRFKKKDTVLRSSKQHSVHASELVANSLSCEPVDKNAARKSCNGKPIPNMDLTSVTVTDNAPQQSEGGPRMTLGGHDFTYRTTVLQFESSNKNEEPYQNPTVPTGINNKKGGLQSALSFGNSCTEDGFAFQTYFGHQFGSSSNFALPDYSFPNVFQTNISSHLNAREPVMQQQFTLNPSLPPPGNVSLSSCTKVSARKPYNKGKRNYQAR